MNSKTSYRGTAVLRAALQAACDFQEAVTGLRPWCVLHLDINGTIARLGGNEYPEGLAVAIARAVYGGILVVPTSDNPNGGISEWFRRAGVPLWMIPVRVGDHGARVFVEIPGMPKFRHHLVDPLHLASAEERFVMMRRIGWEHVRKHGLLPVAGHPTITHLIQPGNGEVGFVNFDWTRFLGFSGEVRVLHNDGRLDGCQDRVRQWVGSPLLEQADALGLELGERENEANRFWFGPKLPVRKIEGADEVSRALPDSIRVRSQIGDSGNEFGLHHIVDIAFAPRDTAHARNHGVLELSRTCVEGAVPEAIEILLSYGRAL